MRVLNRLLALIAALALIAFAVLFTVEVVAAVAGNSPVIIHWHQAYTDGKHNTWGNAGPRVTFAVLTGIGAILVLAQLKPRRVIRVPLANSDSDVDSAMSKRGVRHALNAAASSVDGVTKAKTKVRRGRAVTSVKVIGGGKDMAGAVESGVTEAVNSRIEDLQLRRKLRVKINMRTHQEKA